MICDWCKYTIPENHPSCQISVGRLLHGKKSGQAYHSSDLEKPYILHLHCVSAFVYRDQDILDAQRERLLAEVRRDEVEDLKQIALSEAAEELRYLCAECGRHKNDPDSPPAEYACSDCGSGAVPICPDCGTVADLAFDDLVNTEAA